MSFEAIVSVIADERTVRTARRDYRATVLELLQAVGYAPTMEHVSRLRAIDREEAAVVVERCIRLDLANGLPCIEVHAAEDLAARLMDCFDAGTTFLTNATWDGERLSSWTDVSRATFDSGIIAIGNVSAIVWFEDED